MPGEFLSDVKTIRQRARQHIERGAVTEAYGADLPTVIKLLNEALAATRLIDFRGLIDRSRAPAVTILSRRPLITLLNNQSVVS